MPNTFRAPASILKNGQKRLFSTEGLIALHMASGLLCSIVYSRGQYFLYPMVFTACRCDFPLPSNRPGIGAMLVRFSPPSIFPALMLNQLRTMVHVITCKTAACRSHGVLIVIQYISHLRLPHVKIGRRAPLYSIVCTQ